MEILQVSLWPANRLSNHTTANTSPFATCFNSSVYQKKVQHQILQRKVNRDLFQRLDANNDGEVDKFEFLSAMLLDQGLVKSEDIDKIMTRFAELDVDNSGSIDISEAKAAHRREEMQEMEIRKRASLKAI